MVSLLLNASLAKSSTIPSTNSTSGRDRKNFISAVSCRRAAETGKESSSTLLRNMIRTSLVPVAISLSVAFWSIPAHAGFFSGFSGIESIPGPQLPQINFIERFNEENQKKYAENDAKFKESPILKKLLEQSRLNKEKNEKAILDKYCIRGAEWGVGDCSAEGMTPEEREKFIAMLKQKAGVD